jgi:hypothetical protein
MADKGVRSPQQRPGVVSTGYAQICSIGVHFNNSATFMSRTPSHSDCYFGAGVVVPPDPFLLLSAFFPLCAFVFVFVFVVFVVSLALPGLPPVACANTAATVNSEANKSFFMSDSP